METTPLHASHSIKVRSLHTISLFTHQLSPQSYSLDTALYRNTTLKSLCPLQAALHFFVKVHFFSQIHQSRLILFCYLLYSYHLLYMNPSFPLRYLVSFRYFDKLQNTLVKPISLKSQSILLNSLLKYQLPFTSNQ